MAENKTKPTSSSVADFLKSCSEEGRRADAEVLARMMQAVTGQEPAMWGTAIVGFDSYHYTYDSGREGDMPVLGFSPRKSANVLYGMLGFEGAEVLLAKLGKHTTGKGCLYLKRLADVDLEVLRALMEQAAAATRARHPR